MVFQLPHDMSMEDRRDGPFQRHKVLIIEESEESEMTFQTRARHGSGREEVSVRTSSSRDCGRDGLDAGDGTVPDGLRVCS